MLASGTEVAAMQTCDAKLWTSCQLRVATNHFPIVIEQLVTPLLDIITHWIGVVDNHSK